MTDTFEPKVEDSDLRILKAIITESRLAIDFANRHTPNLFVGPAYSVGKMVVQHAKVYKNSPTRRVLLEQYQNNPTLTNHINQIFDSIKNVEFNSREYDFEVEKLKNRYVDHKFNSLKNEIKFNDNLNSDQLLTNLQKTLKEVEEVKRSAKESFLQKPIDEYIAEFYEEYVAQINSDLGEKILTGYSYFDHVTGGVKPAEMVIIGGESGGGKSMMLNNMAIQMWMQKNNIATPPDQFTKGFNVLYFSLEMPYKGCFRRTLARLADVPMYGLRDSKLSKNETESVNMACRFIKRFSAAQAKFEIVDIPRGVTVDQIEEKYLEARSRFTPDVVVVDYLGLLDDPTLSGDDWLKLGLIAGKLHEFARTYNTRVLTAVQLNRPSKKVSDPSELIGLERIGRSAQIVHHANIVVQIEKRNMEHLKPDFVYHMIKNRDGELGSHSIRKRFAHGALYDEPYVAPEKDDYGSLVSGFNEEEDISAQVKSIYGIE